MRRKYLFSGLSTFGDLQHKPAVLRKCMVAPWPCQSLHRHLWSLYANSFTESDGVALASTPKDFPQYRQCVLSPRREIYENQKIKMSIVIVAASEI